MASQMISKRLKILKDLQEELNKIKEVYQETLENDPRYQELQEQAKKFREETKERKVKIKNNEVLEKLQEQMKLVKDDVRQNREVLAQELADYYKESGSMVIEDEDGRTRRFVFSVKFIEEKEEE